MSRLVRLLRDQMRMLKEDAQAISRVVEEAFRGQSELDDDSLDPHLRQVFYDLQDEDILKVRRQEYTKDGRILRGYFWSVSDQERGLTPMRPARQDPVEDLYSGLKDGAWERRRPS